MRLRDFERKQRLLDLAGVRRCFAQIIAFRILLRDRGAALARTGRHVGEKSAGYAPQVDAAVRPERAVFGCHDGVAYVIGQRGAVDDVPVIACQFADGRRAIAVIHGAGLRDGEGIRLGNHQRGIFIAEDSQTCRRGKDHRQQDAPHERMAVFGGHFMHEGAVRGNRAVAVLRHAIVW